jgi:hypothetical protein
MKYLYSRKVAQMKDAAIPHVLACTADGIPLPDGQP